MFWAFGASCIELTQAGLYTHSLPHSPFPSLSFLCVLPGPSPPVVFPLSLLGPHLTSYPLALNSLWLQLCGWSCHPCPPASPRPGQLSLCVGDLFSWRVLSDLIRAHPGLLASEEVGYCPYQHHIPRRLWCTCPLHATQAKVNPLRDVELAFRTKISTDFLWPWVHNLIATLSQLLSTHAGRSSFRCP